MNIYCPNCNAANHDDAEICSLCGDRLQEPKEKANESSATFLESLGGERSTTRPGFIKLVAVPIGIAAASVPVELLISRWLDFEYFTASETAMTMASIAVLGCAVYFAILFNPNPTPSVAKKTDTVSGAPRPTGRKQCPKCKEWIHVDATKCPYCRSTITPLWAYAVAVVFMLAVGLWGFHSCESWLSESWQQAQSAAADSRAVHEAQLREVLGGAITMLEVSWMEFDDNTVYVGFNTRPSDLRALLRAWAKQGQQAIDFGVHIWALDANKSHRGWRPGDGPYHMEVSER